MLYTISNELRQKLDRWFRRLRIASDALTLIYYSSIDKYYFRLDNHKDLLTHKKNQLNRCRNVFAYAPMYSSHTKYSLYMKHLDS